MISASDVPACPACGAREVHPITKIKPRKKVVESFTAALVAEDPIDTFRQGATETFYACRQCGRDVTDAWKDIQPAPPPAPVIGPPDPEPTEPIAVQAHRLGIAATNGSSS